MSKKIGKKEIKKAQNVVKWSEFADISEDELKSAKEKLNPKPVKKKVSKKK